MQHCKNALQNQHLRLAINISHWPRVNVQLGQVFRVLHELHIDGLPVCLQAAFKKAGEMEGILVVRWVPTNSPILCSLRAVKGPWLQKESIQGPCWNRLQLGLHNNMSVHTGHAEVSVHSLGCHVPDMIVIIWNRFPPNKKKTILLGVVNVELAKELIQAQLSCHLRWHRYPTTICPCFASKESDTRVESSNNEFADCVKQWTFTTPTPYLFLQIFQALLDGRCLWDHLILRCSQHLVLTKSFEKKNSMNDKQKILPSLPSFFDLTFDLTFDLNFRLLFHSKGSIRHGARHHSKLQVHHCCPAKC